MASEVTVQQLIKHIEQFGWKHYKAENEPQEKEGIIYTSWRSSPDSRGFRMTIDPMEEKKCLSFKVYDIASAPWESTPPDRLADLMTLMSWINYDVILGKFAYDVRDGEVRLSIDVPIDENDFNYPQFEHTMHVLLSMAERWASHFQALLEGQGTLRDVVVGEAGRRSGTERLVQQLEEAFVRRGDASTGQQPLTEV